MMGCPPAVSRPAQIRRRVLLANPETRWPATDCRSHGTCCSGPAEVSRRLVDHGLLAGLPLAGLAPGLEDGLLVAVTERRTKEDIDRLADAMATVLADLGGADGQREGAGVPR